jgi:hypothetical protein
MPLEQELREALIRKIACCMAARPYTETGTRTMDAAEEIVEKLIPVAERDREHPFFERWAEIKQDARVAVETMERMGLLNLK